MAIVSCLAVLFLIAFLIFCYMLVSSYGKYIFDFPDTASIKKTHVSVGLVLGAGITKNGKPFRELQSRLDIAADSLKKGYVRKLLLSGDNRFKRYDEPAAMENYLVHTKHISKNKLQVDDGGRSTYESCERVSKVFEVKKIIIFSAKSHLPRAIYVCRHFGIEAYGIPSKVEANNSTRREILARAKAIVNIYIYGEKTVLGNPIKL